MTMKRRKFLQASSFSIGVPMMLNGMGLSTITKSKLFNNINFENDRVLVLINLVGGNDGLATLIPMDSFDQLANYRPNIYLPETSLLDIGDNMALHPSLGGVQSLYDDAKVNFIHDVGYPDQNRSHFRSSDIWTSGSPSNEQWTSGWLGRFFDMEVPGFPDGYPNAEFPDPIAITMGSSVSSTCQGTITNFSMVVNDPFELSDLASGGDTFVPDNYYGDELQFLRTSVEQTNQYSEIIVDAANSGANMVDYPDTNLAFQLKNIARLISGGLQTKVYVANIGGFDTHADQVQEGNTTIGNHANLMQVLGDAMKAFQNDLNALGIADRVVGMTFSEFGRQIISNDSNGTDHGNAAPLIVFGDCVNPGFMGEVTPLGNDVQVQEGVPLQFDFRDVYGSVLMDWFEVEESTIQSLLYNEFTYMPILNPCTPTSIDPIPDKALGLHLNCFPNPATDRINLSFDSLDERVSARILDMAGQQVKLLFDRTLNSGNHQMSYDVSSFVSGAYLIQLETDSGRKMTSKFVKL